MASHIRPFAVVLLLWNTQAFLSAAENDAATPLMRVADHVMKETTRRLMDRSNGQTFEDSTNLAPKPEISIESKFNAWFYQTWLLADGMRRVAESLDEPKYRGYGERNLDFIFQHMSYFQRQHDAHMKAAPVGDGKLSPIGFYFDLSALWHTGLAPLCWSVRWRRRKRNTIRSSNA